MRCGAERKGASEGATRARAGKRECKPRRSNNVSTAAPGVPGGPDGLLLSDGVDGVSSWTTAMRRLSAAPSDWLLGLRLCCSPASTLSSSERSGCFPRSDGDVSGVSSLFWGEEEWSEYAEEEEVVLVVRSRDARGANKGARTSGTYALPARSD